MASTKLEIPDISCRYERYNPNTLEPLNDSTNIRLIETGWSRDTFDGKSVLDIGCNSGMLAIFAHDMGARSVRAIDVQAPFVSFFKDVVALHDLPISVEKKAFNDLTPEEDGADVVLCMEVIHWIVHQGGEISDAIAHLASLTSETLYVETPWDVAEPSISSKGNISEERYNFELFARALSRHFEKVRIERFMTYFGTMENSKRVLIMATGKRTSSLPVRHIKDANPTGISLSRGSNASELLTTTNGPKVLKVVPKDSVFAKLDDEEMESFGEFLAQGPDGSPLVPPERFGDRFVSREADGNAYMLFPFVGNLRDYFPEIRTPRPVHNPLELAVGTFRHLAQAPDPIVSALREKSEPLPIIEVGKMVKECARELKSNGLVDFVERVNEELNGYDREREDAIIHNDFQLGNLVLSHNNAGRVVDIDSMRSGPAYTDIFYCALHCEYDAKALMEALANAEKDAARRSNFLDIAFAAGTALLWLDTLARRRDTLEPKSIQRVVNGLKVFESTRKQLD